MPKPDTKPVLVAAIAGAFGVRGEVRIKSFTENPAACLDYAPFTDAAGKEILHISASRPVKGGFAVRAQEVQTREQAMALKGTPLYAPRARFAALAGEDYYQSDLVGLRVEDEAGKPLGRIKAVLNFGAGDVLEIAGAPGVQASWTLPFTRACVPVVDVDGGKVVLLDVQDYLPGDGKEEAKA